MTVFKRKLTILSVAFCILIAEGLFSCLMASNKLFDINLENDERHITLSLTMAERPEFVLKPLNDKQVLLSLINVLKAGEFDKNSSGMTMLGLQEDPQNNQFGIMIAAGKPFDKIDWAWFEEDKILRVFLNLSEWNERQIASGNTPVLNNILFGFKEKATRMVLALDYCPSWEIRYSGPADILLSLNSSSANIEDRSYESNKWLRQVNVKKTSDANTDISLKVETTLNHAGLFWMETGNRLVLDLFNDPSVLIDKTASFNEPEKAIKNAVQKEQPGPKKQGTKTVRMKIPENILSVVNENEEKETIPAVGVGAPMLIKPRLNNHILSAEEEIRVSVRDLDPKEAFLFGRIRQAGEINDFETGITLINQFLKEYPESGLTETLCFRKGDFYYSLWKRGDEEAGKKAILSYKYAIDRFSRSETMPWALIRMAQIESLTGNNFESLGYLSTVLSKKNGGFIPVAYLTRGKIFLSMEQPEKAIKDFETLLTQFSESPYASEANFWVASYYHKMGLYEEAENRLEEVAGSNPDLYLDYPEYLLLRAKNYLYLRDYDAAREYLFKAVNIGGQQEDVDLLLSRIGDTYHNQENEKEAEKYYRMVIDYYPETEGAVISKLRLADYFSDITILEDLSTENTNEPLSELATVEKGYQLFEKKQYAEVIKSLEDMVKKPVQTETRKDAGHLYVNALEKEIERLYENGLYRELIDLYKSRETMVKDVIDPAILLFTAGAYGRIGLYQDAVAAYRQIKPYDLGLKEKGELYEGLVACYMADDDTVSAVQLLEKIEKEGLEFHDAQRLNLIQAKLYREQGREKDAFQLYNAVVSSKGMLADNEIAEAYLNMGIILKNRRDYTGARTALANSIDLAMKDESDLYTLRPAYKELGDVFNMEGSHNKAVRAYEKSFDLGYGTDDPDYWETRFRLAQSYLDLGEPARAEPILTEISEEGDGIMQQRAQIRLGSLNLEKQLQVLSLGKN